MEDDQGGVWISKEEYERLRHSQQQQGAAPVFHQGPTITAASVTTTPDSKFVRTVRRMRTIGGIVAGVSGLLLFTGIAGQDDSTLFLWPIFGVSFIAFLVSSLVSVVSIIKIDRAQILRPRTVIGAILLVMLVIISAPFLYGVFIIGMLFFMMILGGGDVGS